MLLSCLFFSHFLLTKAVKGPVQGHNYSPQLQFNNDTNAASWRQRLLIFIWGKIITDRLKYSCNGEYISHK